MIINCGVRMIAKLRRAQMYDALRYGHRQHECTRLRDFVAGHFGDHRCKCGKLWNKQEWERK
jgi:hypothetical protein